MLDKELQHDIIFTLNHPSEFDEVEPVLERALNAINGSKDAKLLAIDYVEHILWTSDRISKRDHRFQEVLRAAREFINDKLSVEELQPISRNASAAHHVSQIRQERAVECQASASIQHQCFMDFALGSAILTACLVVYGHESATRGLVYAPPTETAFDVAGKAANVIGSHSAGSNWKSGGVVAKQKAQENYKQGQLQETKWQLQHLWELIEAEKSD